MQDWGNNIYPPWAHGPGYVLTSDIAHFVVEGHRKNFLKVHFFIGLHIASPSNPCLVAHKLPENQKYTCRLVIVSNLTLNLVKMALFGEFETSTLRG